MSTPDTAMPVAATPQALNERRAALAVHAMSDTDRRWLLEQLGDRESARLSTLLQELDAMDLPRDASLLESIVRRPAKPAPGSAPLAPAEHLAQLDEAGVEQLARALRAEPPLLVAHLLAARDWPWQAQLRAALGPQRVARIDDCMALARERKARGAEAFERRLLLLLVTAVEGATPDASERQVPASSRYAQWRERELAPAGWWRRWGFGRDRSGLGGQA